MFRTIKNRLIAFCTVIVAVAIGVATAAHYLDGRAQTHRQLAADLAAQGSAHAAAIAAWAKVQKDIVAAMAPAAAAADPRPVLSQAQQSGQLDLAYVGGADKRMVSVPDRKRAADYDPTARPWYKLASTSEQPVITAPYIGASSGKLVVSFASAIKAAGVVHAVAGTDVSLDDVVATIKRIKPTASGFAMLMDPAGKIIAHPDPKLALKPATELSADLDAASLAKLGGDGLLEAAIGGHRYFLHASPVEGTEWRLVTAAESSEALAPLNALLRTAGVTLVCVALVAMLASALIIGAQLRGLVRVRDAMDEIASGNGDLQQRLPEQGSDEIGDIARSFNLFVGKIGGVMADVRRTSHSVAVASRQIAAGNLDLSQRTEQTAGQLQQTAGAMVQLEAAVGHSADAAAGASRLAGAASEAAQRGGAVVAQVVTTMQQIQESSHRIGDIIGTIDGIAFQTNILALNAAVEAARAGEQGRGFAVVAAEVRALARRSAEAAKEIKNLIDSSVERVNSGSELVADAGATMNDVLARIAEVGAMVGQVSGAAAEQRDGVTQVSGAVAGLDQMTQHNAALVEESAAAAQSLKGQADQLAAAVGMFRLSEDAIAA